MDEVTAQPLDCENPSATASAALRSLEQRAQAALAAHREHALRLESQITNQIEQIAATLNEQAGAETADTGEVSGLRAEFDEAKANWADERVSLEAARDALTQQVTKLEADQRQTREAWQKQLLDFEEKLGQQYSAWNEQRKAWSHEREGLERDREELRQKFELALEDVHRFRGRIAELEQELSRRPETIEADSAELVALRAERSALSERVEQLERQPAAQNDPNSEQQVADLQRRFELAVEDVRELKTKNAQLEAQVASAGNRTIAAVDSGGTDWESQKRRLLESLEGTDESQADPVRQKERVTIESTIEMTDSIVAQKDREIADLKTQLVSSGNAEIGRVAEEHDQQIRELVDADEVIAEHRKRIAQFEREMEDKLRAAELELSIERAKIARQNAELDDMRAELQSERRAYGDHGLPAGAPRRRWLSKLGLSGEEAGP
jgi:chromosome segregation ATPase